MARGGAFGEHGAWATRGDRRQDATHPLVHRLDVEFLDLSRCSERRVVSGTTGVSIGFKESGTGFDCRVRFCTSVLCPEIIRPVLIHNII